MVETLKYYSQNRFQSIHRDPTRYVTTVFAQCENRNEATDLVSLPFNSTLSPNLNFHH